MEELSLKIQVSQTMYKKKLLNKYENFGCPSAHFLMGQFHFLGKCPPSHFGPKCLAFSKNT